MLFTYCGAFAQLLPDYGQTVLHETGQNRPEGDVAGYSTSVKARV